MNVQDVIEKALAGNDGIPVTPVEHSSCEDVQVEKLASALNFIGANLESSVDDFEQEKSAFIATIAGGVGAHKARERMRRAGLSEDDIDDNQTVAGGAVRGLGRGMGYGLAGSLVGPVGATAGQLFGAYRGYQHAQELANRAIEKDRVRRARYAQDKTASAEDVEQEKTALDYRLEDLADPRIPGGSHGLAAANNIASIAALGGGAAGKSKARKKMIDAGFSSDEIDDALRGSTTGGALRGLGGGVAGSLAGMALAKTPLVGSLGAARNLANLGGIAGSAAGGYSGYKKALERADKAIAARKGRKKTASVDDALYQAAQVGKQSLLEKVAEDRINPAKISAGPAAPYSGEIMPRGENVFGGQTMPAQLVAMKAQKVRARINGDMKKFVNNVGTGYNLEGHLNKMNK